MKTLKFLHRSKRLFSFSRDFSLGVGVGVILLGGGILATPILTQVVEAVDTFWASNGNDVHNTNSGNVGIGTTSPNYKLHVVGTSPSAFINSDNSQNITGLRVGGARSTPSTTFYPNGTGDSVAIEMALNDSALNSQVFASLKAGGSRNTVAASSMTDGAEEGELTINLMRNGMLREALFLGYDPGSSLNPPPVVLATINPGDSYFAIESTYGQLRLNSGGANTVLVNTPIGLQFASVSGRVERSPILHFENLLGPGWSDMRLYPVDSAVTNTNIRFGLSPGGNATISSIMLANASSRRDFDAFEWRVDGSTVSFNRNPSGVPNMNINLTAFNSYLYDVDYRISGRNVVDLFYVDASSDRVGVGTAFPQSKFHVSSNATTTARFDTASATQGTCLIMKDVSGALKYIRIINDAFVINSSSCE